MIQTWIQPRTAVATALALMLAGCGGDDSDTSVSPPPPPVVDVKPIMAIDGFSVASPQTTTHIDLTPYIRGGKGDVTAVVYTGDDAENCAAPAMNGAGFDVIAQSGALCDYEFTVKNTQTHARASMTVLATKAVTPILPPLSLPLVLDTTPIATSINLTGNEWLGSDYPAGYILKSVSVQGGDDNLGAVAPVTGGTTIAYTPPTMSGWNRLVYTLKNASKPDEDIIGSVYVTISESINQPPAISKPRYDYNAENSNATVLTGAAIDINLGSGFITELDGQDWQVIEAQSYTGTVGYKDPNSVTNKVLTFTAATIGDHIISYVVADHFGGYSVGLVKVTVSAKEQTATWASLTAEGSLYTAPLRYSDAYNAGQQANAQWDNPVGNTIAGYNVNGANLYCSTVGTIPTVAEMNILRDTHYTTPATTGDLNKWPAVKPYLAQNEAGTGYVGYNIQTGVAAANPSGTYYVTCIENPNLTLTMITRQVVANNTVTPIATIRKPVGTSIVLSKVPTGQPTDLTEAQVNIRLVAEGSKTTVTTNSIKAGAYRFKITSSADITDEISSPTINYIADVNTAELKPLTIDVNNAVADNKDTNKVTATILDANNNPVPSQQIAVTLTEHGTTAETASLINHENALFTNTSGAVSLSIKDSEVEKVDVGVYMMKEPSATEVADITFKEFKIKRYCHQFPEVNDFNCLPIHKTGDIWFSAPPSSQWLAANNPVLAALAVNRAANIIDVSGELGNAATFMFKDRGKHCAHLRLARYAGRADWAEAVGLPSKKNVVPYSLEGAVRGIDPNTGGMIAGNTVNMSRDLGWPTAVQRMTDGGTWESLVFMGSLNTPRPPANVAAQLRVIDSDGGIQYVIPIVDDRGKTTNSYVDTIAWQVPGYSPSSPEFSATPAGAVYPVAITGERIVEVVVYQDGDWAASTMCVSNGRG